MKYTIIITLLISYLKGSEKSLVGKVDEKVRILIDKIRLEEGRGGLLNDIKKPVPADLTGFAEKIVEAFGNNIGMLIAKIDELKQDLQRPPRYDVIVKPFSGAKDDE